MYDRYEDAQKVVHDLEASGVPTSEISMISNAEGRGTTTGTGAGDTAGDTAAHSAGAGGTGAVAGTAIGGGLGLARVSARWRFRVLARSSLRAG